MRGNEDGRGRTEFGDPFPPPGADRGAEPADSGLRLRPFLLTGGRTHTHSEAIALETQVVATQHGYAHMESLSFEHRDIVALCGLPLSVAEISARLSLHLGVVHVLVGDLALAGCLHVHTPEKNDTHSIHTITRVLNGLRAIT